MSAHSYLDGMAVNYVLSPDRGMTGLPLAQPLSVGKGRSSLAECVLRLQKVPVCPALATGLPEGPRVSFGSGNLVHL